MNIEELREDLLQNQKKGLPFILSSVFIWIMIAIVLSLDINIMTKNIFVFCCSCPLMPLAWVIGKILKVDIFSKKNPNPLVNNEKMAAGSIVPSWILHALMNIAAGLAASL